MEFRDMKLSQDTNILIIFPNPKTENRKSIKQKEEITWTIIITFTVQSQGLASINFKTIGKDQKVQKLSIKKRRLISHKLWRNKKSKKDQLLDTTKYSKV